MAKLEGYSKDGYVGTQIRRLRDPGIINVWDFRSSKPSGVMCDGTDDYPAFAAARDSVASGQSICVHVPRGAYVLNSNVLDNGRYLRLFIEAGATFSGSGILYVSNKLFDKPVTREEYFRGVPGANQVVGELIDITNNSASTAGYGLRLNYTHAGAVTAGFDLATGVISDWVGMAGGQAQNLWSVYHTPNSNTWTGGFVASEMNPVNRGPDMGWAKQPGVQVRWHGGQRFVPESQDFTGDGGTGRHVLFAYSVSRSGSNNADGVRARTYNGYMIEPDAIAPAGYCAIFNGMASASPTNSYTGLGLDGYYKNGLNLMGATFENNYALMLAASHKVTWRTSGSLTADGTERAYITGASGYLVLNPGSTGYLTLIAPDSTATGGNARGANAVDLQGNRSTAAQVASGQYSAILSGSANTATGIASAVLAGTNNVAGGNYSVASGAFATSRSQQGKFAHSAGAFVNAGDAQAALNVLRLSTTDATATPMSANGSAPGAATAIVLPNNSVHGFRGEVVARNTSTNDCAVWTVEGLIKRTANAASTALVGTPTVTKTFNDAGASTWALAVEADTTNGALQIKATGQAATTIRWVANIRTTEVA